MKKIKTIIRSIFLPFYRKGMGVGFIVPFLTVGFGWLLVSCSEVVEIPDTEKVVDTPINLTGYMVPFEDFTDNSMARGQLIIDNGQLIIDNGQLIIDNGQLPLCSRFSLATPSAFRIHNSQLTRTEPIWMPDGYTSITEVKAIGAFFTKDAPSATSDARYIQYNTSDSKWHAYGKGTDPLSGDYLYGYMPYNAATVNIAPNPTYAAGATLTFTNMNSISENDICVVVGASNGTDDTHPTSLQTGKFSCTMKEGEGQENHLFLLFNHLYSALSFKMKVDDDYNRLRTIKVKELRMQTYTGTAPSYTLNKKNTNVTITLTANNTGEMPFTEVTYTPDPSSGADTEGSIFFNDEDGVALTTSGETFISNFVPENVVKINLTSTYDVYDKQDNLIRTNCKATNTIYLSFKEDGTEGVFGRYFVGCQRGYKYTINLTIQPTYLYMLSEPDLDNPSVIVD